MLDLLVVEHINRMALVLGAQLITAVPGAPPCPGTTHVDVGIMPVGYIIGVTVCEYIGNFAAIGIKVDETLHLGAGKSRLGLTMRVMTQGASTIKYHRSRVTHHM
jgi:hypothetical protein